MKISLLAHLLLFFLRDDLQKLIELCLFSLSLIFAYMKYSFIAGSLSI